MIQPSAIPDLRLGDAPSLPHLRQQDEIAMRVESHRLQRARNLEDQALQARLAEIASSADSLDHVLHVITDHQNILIQECCVQVDEVKLRRAQGGVEALSRLHGVLAEARTRRQSEGVR